MPILSNLYAERVYAEQPIALWALDDNADFVSLITPAVRSFTGWQLTGATKSASTDLVRQIKKSPLTKFVTSSSSGFTATSPNVFSKSDLDASKETFSISTYFYSLTDEIRSVKIGYVYQDGTPGQMETYQLSVPNTWVFLSKTYEIPTQTQAIKLVVEVEAETDGDYTFYINGLSAGQWSEKFSASSDGIDLIELPEELSQEPELEDLLAYPAYGYGFSDSNGYYLTSGKNLAAYNDGFPMVFGASGVTRIVGDSSQPSLIVPGKGFLHEFGKYQGLTLEFWLKVNTSSLTPTKIVGPVFSSDGLYVDGQSLALKIGRNVSSYYVGEWERPMLVDIKVSPTTASLMINGESVMTMDIDVSAIDMPSQQKQDWIGFYGNFDGISLDIDCVAIYPYQVQSVVAKRRFVYGQGVDIPESINGSLVGSGITIDYPVAGYSNNYIYPDMGRWSRGIVENLSTANSVLSTPRYELPSVVFKNKDITTDEWLELCDVESSEELGPFLKLPLADTTSSSGGHIVFDKLTLSGKDVKAVYGIFELASGNSNGQILIKMQNEISGADMTLSIQSDKLSYTFSYPGQSSATIQTDLPTSGPFLVGLDFDKMASVNGGVVARVLGESRKMSLFVGGQKSFANTFSGNIYGVGLSVSRPVSLVPIEDGILINDSQLIDSRGSFGFEYHFAPQRYLGSFVLDISSRGYWQDQVALSHFGKVMRTLDGDSVPTLSYLQFNIDVPKMDIYTGENQSELITDDLPVRTYISFQYLSTGANRKDVSFTSLQRPIRNAPVIPGDAWQTTLYEVVSGSVIYLPKNVDYKKLSIVTHIRIKTESSITKPVRIKRLEFCSQSLSNHEPLRLGTKLGVPITPYVKRGLYMDYLAINPVEIYKRSTPYLHLTKNSGIQLLDYYDYEGTERAVSIPVNQNRSSEYALGAVQIFLNYQQVAFPQEPVKILDLRAYNRSTEIYIQADTESGQRGRIFAIDKKTRLPDQFINFYLNGKIVKTPYLEPKQWDVLSLQFIEGLKFDGFSGSINLSGPMLFNNISTYRLTETQTSITSVFRTWAQIEQFFDKPGDEETYWGDFLSASPQITWENILFIPTLRRFLIDPAVIFAAYSGTNRISVSDDSVLMFKNYKYTMYNNVRWRSNIVSPV